MIVNLPDCLPKKMDYAAARRTMVENQIRTNRVTDPLVVTALSELPREDFLPESLKGIAYVDEDIPLGGGRALIEPLAAALILEAAEISPTDIVLEVGCGVGYTAAAASRLASAVFALESDPGLADRARQVLDSLDLATVSVVEGPLTAGYAEQAPYDVILFGGSIPQVPQTILDQLAEGGRLVAIISQEAGLGKGTVFLKTGGIVSQRVVFDAAVPPLSEFVPAPTFRF
jgi:Protein-L-isoaspartate carboxylmethyltransferase